MIKLSVRSKSHHIHCPTHTVGCPSCYEDTTEVGSAITAGTACRFPGCSCPSFVIYDE